MVYCFDQKTGEKCLHQPHQWRLLGHSRGLGDRIYIFAKTARRPRLPLAPSIRSWQRISCGIQIRSGRHAESRSVPGEGELEPVTHGISQVQRPRPPSPLPIAMLESQATQRRLQRISLRVRLQMPSLRKLPQPALVVNQADAVERWGGPPRNVRCRA